MIHDFVLTKNYAIVFDCPVVFDLNQLMIGGSILNWQPELGVRIGLMSRATGIMNWFHTDPFFVFHFANAYEQDNKLIIDYVKHEKVVLLTAEKNKEDIPPRLNRTVIDLDKGALNHTTLDDKLVEFPRIREDRDTLTHQFIYTPTKTSNVANNRAFNALVKYDVKNNGSQVYDFGPFTEIGEAVFTPSKTSQSEDDGYLMLFAYDSTTNQSEFVILDAMNFGAAPLARIKMPRRIPSGLHGSWMPGEW